MANGPDTAQPAATKMLSVSITEARKAGFVKLTELSVKLNARMSDLVWDAVTKYLSSPPSIAPVGSSRPRGSSYGYWVVHTFDPAGKITDIHLVDGLRNATVGAHFFRYAKDDAGSKSKALNQAQHCAMYDGRLSGFKVGDKGVRIEKAK